MAKRLGPRIGLTRSARREPSDSRRAKRAELDVAALRDALEGACLDEIRGDGPSRVLAGKLVRACRVVLRAHGLGEARIDASSTRAGTFVEILLPRPDKTVERVVLDLG